MRSAQLPERRRVMVVAPHPDDETIGAGIFMAKHPGECCVLHLTPGCPRDVAFAHAVGFSSRDLYRVARLQELETVLDRIGIPSIQRRQLRFVDRELHLHIPSLIANLATAVENWRPSIILSPAYEGGHPDHDSAAFAVACLNQSLAEPFEHREYRLYHADPTGQFDASQFLPSADSRVDTVHLTNEERAHKRFLLELFATQQDMLWRFELVNEQFREAPSYDFRSPPHEGRLLYEQWSQFSHKQWLEHCKSKGRQPRR